MCRIVDGRSGRGYCWNMSQHKWHFNRITPTCWTWQKRFTTRSGFACLAAFRVLKIDRFQRHLIGLWCHCVGDERWKKPQKGSLNDVVCVQENLKQQNHVGIQSQGRKEVCLNPKAINDWWIEILSTTRNGLLLYMDLTSTGWGKRKSFYGSTETWFMRE